MHMKQLIHALAFGIFAMLFASSCLGGLVMENLDWDDDEPEVESSVSTDRFQPPPSPETLGNGKTMEQSTSQNDETPQLVTCPECNGSGKGRRFEFEPCIICEGAGLVEAISEPVECFVCKGSGKAAGQDDHSAYPVLTECWSCKGQGFVWVASAEATRRAYQSVKDLANGFSSSPNGYSVPSHSSNVSRKTRVCPACDGKGYDLDRWIEPPNYSGTSSENWCDECKRWGSSHVHDRRRCPLCGGRGKIEDYYNR